MDIGNDAAPDWLTVRAAKLCLDLQHRDRTVLKLSLGLNAVLILLGWPMLVVYAAATFGLIWLAMALFIAVTTIAGMTRQ